MEKPLQTLHKSLLENDFDVPEDYSSFEETLSLPGKEGYQNRLTLWKALRDNDYDVPDNYEDFRITLFDTKPKKGGMISNTVKAENGMTFTEAGLDSLEKGATPVYATAEAEPQPTEPIDLTRPEEYQIPKPFVQGAEEARQMADSPELNKQWAQRQAMVAVRSTKPDVYNFGDRMYSLEQAAEADAARKMKRGEYDKQNAEKFYQEHVAPVFSEERAAGEERAKKAVQEHADEELAGRLFGAPQTVAGATSNIGRAFQAAVDVERETDPAKIAAATIKRVQNDDAFGDYVLSRMGISGQPDNAGAGESEPLSEREKNYMQLLFATETNEVADQMIQRIYNQYKAEGAPKSALDYIAGKAFHENFVASLFDAMVRRVANSSGMREQLRALASEEYGQDASWLTRAAGGAAPFAVDMLTGGFAAPTAVGNALVKGGMRMAAKEVTREMGKRAAARGLKDAALEEAVAGGAGVAERYLATQAPILNFALRSAGSAANFATYDVQSELVRQLTEGEFNAGNLIKQAVHGATLGGVLGATGGVIANATRNSGLTKKVLADIAGVGAETGIFAAANGIEKAHQLGIDIADVDWADTTGEALGMVLGMKTVGAVTHPKEFLKRYQQSKDLGMQLNQRDIQELKQAGYNFDSIFKGLGEFGKIAPESATVRRGAAEYTEDATGKRDQRNTETTEAYVDADAFNAFMNNPEISSSLKRKVAFIATGKVLSLEPVFGASMDVDENGNVTITTKNVYGNPIETKEYQSIEQAQQDYQLMQEMARANTIGGLERIADKTGYQDVVDTAKGRTEAETGVDVDNLDKLSELTTEEANGVLDAYIKNLQDAYMERFNENLERIGDAPSGEATGIGGNVGGLPSDGRGATKTERRQAAYERGASVAEDESQLPGMNYDGKLAEARMMALMPDGDQAGYARQQIMQALAQDDVEAAERILQQQSPYLSAEQREAVDAYIDNYEMRLGIDDAVEKSINNYKENHRKYISSFLADPQGNVTALRLKDNSIVYYQSGDMNGFHSSVFVTDGEGNNKQIDSNEIAQVEYTRPAEEMIAEDVAAFSDMMAKRYNYLADGSMLMDGQEADMVMGNQMFHVKALGQDEQGNTIVQMEDGSRMAMTPLQMAEAIDAADMVKIQEVLSQEKQADALRQRAQRFSKGIVGYAEGTPNLTHKDTKPEVAAEYLLSQTDVNGQPVDRKQILNNIQQEIDKTNEKKLQALQKIQQARNDMAMAEEGEEAYKEAELTIRMLEPWIADVDSWRKKWGEIRQAMMTDEERQAFEKDRAKEISKAKSQSKIVESGEGTREWEMNMPTKEQVVEKYPERSDGEAFVEEQKNQLSQTYRNDVYPKYDDIQKQLDDYQHGLTDLTPDEVKALTDQQARLSLRMTEMVNEMNAWKKLSTELARAYTVNERQNMTPHEQAMAKLAAETDKAKKLKLAQEAFKDDAVALAYLDNMEPQDVYEYIAENLGAHSINWEGLKRGEHEVRGLIAEMGKDKKRGVGADYDTNGYNYFLAPTGQGKGIDEIIHDLYEGSPYRDDEVRNALLTMLKEAEKPTDISHRVIDDRIAQAEQVYEQNRERERYLEEEAQRQAEDEAIMQMTGMTPEEYDAYISDLEQRLAEQKGYQNSEEYFNQLANEYDRTDERRAGGSQEKSTLVVQGQEGKQTTAEAEGQGGGGEADAKLVKQEFNQLSDNYNSVPVEYVEMDMSDSDLISAINLPQDIVEGATEEDMHAIAEEIRAYFKKEDTLACYFKHIQKILVIASKMPVKRVRESFFHENTHHILEKWYGTGSRGVAERFWENAPSEGGRVTKDFIKRHYSEDKQKEEFFVTWLGKEMADGTVDNMLQHLPEEADQQRLENILKEIGYDRTKENANKGGETEEGEELSGGERPVSPDQGTDGNGGVSDQENNSFPARLAKAKEETNVNPTEEQKKAGNYKMGHISFGGYQMSIENPKGSVRSGVDATGKPWSIEMQDTYGYIGKKFGTDGDHLDFFINDDADLDNWNGRVYVVDQKKEDGTFDEHKVMYGYPNFAAAKKAYLRNYEPGWWDKHVMSMTGVRKDVFDKWLEDSDRKTKPFADYSRTRKADTVSNNIEQLMADVEERKMAKPATSDGKNAAEVQAGYKAGELEAMSIDELKQARKKRKADLSTARLMLGTIDKLKNTDKAMTLQNTVAQATADIAAIEKEIEKKSDLFRQQAEQQEIGGAMVDQLENMGFDVTTDPSEMRQARKKAEKDNSEEGKLRHFKTSDGNMYGFVYKGKMFLDPRKIDANLPIHEYAHPWCEAFRKLNPEGWKNIVDVMRSDKDTWEFVKSLNPDLKNDDDIAEEMIAKGSGEAGQKYAQAEYERMNQRDPEYKSKWGNIWKNISKAIQDFWKAVGDFLHIKYESAEQVYDQVVRDFANKINPRKRVEQWLKERDKTYIDAVNKGNMEQAKELFDAALRENIGNGITPYIAVEGYRKMRPLAHAIKERDPKVIAKVADMMAPLIPKDAVLVPAPSHSGKATDMLDLAKAISERTGAPVADVLTSGERPSQYEAKYAGKPIAAKDMGIVAATEQLPADKLPVVIDNVVDTGNTAEACVQALGKGIVASLADSVEKRKHVSSLKSAEPVVTDKDGNVIPLSDRFQFMIEEGSLFSDEDFEEPKAATIQMPHLDDHGLNLSSELGKRLAELKHLAGENGLVGYTTDDAYVFVGDSTKAVGNTYTSEGERDGMQTVTVSQKQFDTLSPKLVKAGYKMAFLESPDVEPISTIVSDADSIIHEVEHRKEVAADKKEANNIVKQYLSRKPKTDDERVKQLATKGVLTAMDNAGVPYKAVSKEEEKQMLQIFSMMNQEPIKEFARSAYMRATTPHGRRGRYIIYDMSNPYGVPMYFEKRSTARYALKNIKQMVPNGSWEIMDIGYPEDAIQQQPLRKAADIYPDLQAEIQALHGTGYTFTKFDHSHMSEGAGSQVFGWGTYLTSGEKIAEDYANTVAKRKYNDETPGYNGKEVLYKGEKINLDQSKLDPLRLAYDALNNEGTIRKAVAFVERLMDYAEEQDMKDTWQEVLNILKNSKKSDFKVRNADLTDKRFIYKVDIPEDTGDNYLDWMTTIKKPLRKKIADAVRQLDGEPQQSFVYTNYKNGWESLADMIEREQFAYKEIHDRLLMAFGGRVKDAEKVSKLMNSLGFVGVKYPAGTIWGGGAGATNYVIFNEDDAKIVQTISFMWGDEPAAGTVAPIFVSNALKAAEDIKQEKATPEQWLAMLQKNGGLKAGEDKWLGLSDWLKQQKGSVTKQDVLDYIRKNQIEVEEVPYQEYFDVDNLPKMQEFRKEFDELVSMYENRKATVEKEMETFDPEMSEKYGYGWANKLEGKDLERYNDIYDRYEKLTTNDTRELAFEDMLDRYGDDFSMAFEVNYGNGKLEPQMDMYGDDISDAAKHLLEFDVQPINSTRLGYTTNGLENKREIALTVPTIEPWNESDQIHFGDADNGRAVAWIRFGDTVIEQGNSVGHQAAKRRMDAYYDYLVDKYGNDDDPLAFAEKLTPEESAEMSRLEAEYDKTFGDESKKVLVIDEIQSKRHQDARNQGYSNTEEIKRLERKFDELIKKQKEVTEKEKAIYDEIAATDEVKAMLDKNGVLKPEYQEEYNKIVRDNEELQRLSREWAVYGQSIRATRDDITYEKNNGIPDAPFEKNWHELAMKRMLRYAAENGYDKIAWTTGEQQADRYDIGDKIKDISVSVATDPMTGKPLEGKYEIFPHNHNNSTIMVDGASGVMDKDQVLRVYGKDLGQRMIDAADKAGVDGDVLSGDDLRIGAEGMQGFYDEILVRFMNKYGKKWGVKVEKIDLPGIGENANGMDGGLTMWSIDVTPEMKESVMQGQPMFQKEGKKLLGWSDGKQVYLTKDGLNPNTPLHETTHLWDNWCMKEHPDLWQKLVAAMKKTAMWEEVASNPNYRNIWNDENRMASEVHARLSGAAGEDEFMKAAFKKDTPQSIINEVKNALRKFWEAVLRLFGKHTKTIGDDWTSLDAIIRMPIRDLVNQDFEKVMRVADPYDDANAMLGYHGSSAIFDKFDLSKVGSGEGQAVSGHGIYVTSSEGTARYYAKVSSDRRRNVIQKMGYTVNGEIVHDPALVRANEYMKKADNNVDEAIKACEHTIEVLNRHRDKNPFGSLPDAGKSNAEQAMDYLLQEKEHPGTLGFQEEIVEQPAKQVYEVEIPDDTGKNYFDLDKKLTKKQKEDIKKSFFERINSGEEADYWKKNRDIIDYEWKIVDSNEGTGDAARGVMEQFLPSEDVSKIFSELGYVGSKVKGSDGTTYIIYNNDDLKIKKRAELMFHIEDDHETVKRLDKEPKEVGYRNVVANEDGTLGSPMANRLGKKGEGKKATTPFEYGKWERSDEHPELANEQGKIDLIKPDGKSVGGVDYNPYIHIRPNKVNKQFKQAWERPNLIYVETEYPKSELNGDYRAVKAAKTVGKHKWGTQGEYLILSRWDKPVRMVPWEEVADDWVKEFEGTEGIHFDIIPPKLLPILVDRGMKILPPHKGMGKDCQEAYKEFIDSLSGEYDIMRSKGEKLAAHDTTGFADVAEAAGEALGGVKVNAVTSADADAKLKAEIENGTKGIYDPNTHTVTLLLDNIEDAADAVRTVFHEKLGHEGLVDLLGSQEAVDKFGTFVYRSAKNDVRNRILAKADEIDPEWKDGARYSKAAQEVLADIAEEGPKTADEFDLWTKVKHYLIALLNKLGLKIRGLLNDKDLAYYIVKTGAALKKWNAMSEEARQNLAQQASNHDIMRSVNGKPRQKKGESMAQYFQRLKEWEKWREARRMAKENNDPEPKEEDFHESAEADYKQALQEWKDNNGITDEEAAGTFPKRQDGETPQEYAVRVAQYESDKDMWATAPQLMDYLRRANEEYRAAYTAWRERYDLQEEMSVDQRIYEGAVEPDPTFTDAEQEAQYLAEKDLADAEGFEIDEAGAKRMAKLAVIERRKDFESANAEDAIWVYDFMKKSDAVAKELSERIPDATGKELRAALPFLIEADRRRENLEAERENAVMEVNKSESVQNAHTFIDYYNMDAIEDELKALNDAWDYKEKHPTGDAQQAYREAAARLAEKLNELNKDMAGYNKLFADDIMQIRSLLNHASVTGRGEIMPEWAKKYQGLPEVQQLMEHIKAWYDEFYQVLEDAGLRGDAGFIDDGYVNHVWDKEKSDPKAWEQYVENRQRTKSPNMRHREIDTYMDGISIGLVPKYTDIADMIAHYSRQNNEAVANSHFLDDLKFVVVQEMNDEGEVKAILPLLMTDKPDGLLRDKYAQYYVPGVGDVYVLKHIQKRFANIFGTMRTPDAAQWLSNLGKGYDIISSTAKKIQLALSGFHALALWEVDIAQNGPVDALKHLAKYIIVDSIKGGALPAYTHPEDFQLAAKHLVQLGATEDYAAADVNAITKKMREFFKELQMDDAEWKKAAGTVGSPAAIFMDWINQGFDTVLWNYLHDGLKLCAFKELAKQVERRVAGKELDEDTRERMLDEAGQYVNDMFGGQYWELINISPATLKWMRRFFLSPDWLLSTNRHFFANFGFGSVYSDGGFREYVKYNWDNIQRLFGKDVASNELRRLRSRNAKICYLIGAVVWFGMFYNAINALMRWMDEKDEKAKAEEERKTNPNYKSPYELAYPDGMKWYDYTMYGNAVGQQTHLFTGRYSDGTETYVRWGKQFREFPELFIGRHGVEFPSPLIQRMMSKANPNIGTVIDFLGAQNIGGFNGSYENKELREKYGKTVATLSAMARHFIPFGMPTQTDKEYKWLDFFMPSSKGFSRYKAKDYFETFIMDGDWNGIEATYNACVMNGIDAEKALNAAIASIKATQRREMTDDVTDLSSAAMKFDAATKPDERKALLNKLKKHLKDSEYKVMTRDEAIEKVHDFIDGDVVSEKENTRYIMLATSEDIIAEEKLNDLDKKAKKYIREVDEASPNDQKALEMKYAVWFDIHDIIKDANKEIKYLKKKLGGMDDDKAINDIREEIRIAQQEIDKLQAPK